MRCDIRDERGEESARERKRERETERLERERKRELYLQNGKLSTLENLIIKNNN
jgi:hypothetical protein